jgi:transglutaminase-like putative cysteine protease
MSQRHPLAVVAGAATLFAAFPLTTVFASYSWFFYVVIAVVVVSGTAMLARAARTPVWVQVLAMMAALLLYLTFAFPSGEEIGWLLPSAATFRHFNELFLTAGWQIRSETIPVPDSDGLLLLTAAGVGLVAVLVDLAAVGLRRPALAGLPMLAIYSVPVAVLPDGLSFLPFGFAAAGYLWLLVADSIDRVRRFGRRFTGEGRDVNVWEPSPLSSAGRRLGVIGVALALVLPLAIPGMTSGLIDRFGHGLGGNGRPGAGAGQTGATVDLSAMLTKNLVQSQPFDMVKVTTSDPAPFYLKFGVADQITKDGFTSRPPASGTPVTRGITDVVSPDAVGVDSQRFRAQVQAVNFAMPLVPTFGRLAATAGLDAQWLYDPSTEQLYSNRTGASIDGKRYSFEYVHMSYSPAALRTATAVPAQDNGRELIAVPAIPQISERVRVLTAGKTTEYDKVRAIYDSFSSINGFRYSFDVPGGTSGSAIVDFLTNKTGFCVQYAAAMAWLVRAAGFPARVAFGFTRGDGPNNGSYTLTNVNLHAWAEVFFPTFGWVPFDPTPAGSVPGAVQSNWAPDASNTIDGDPGDALAEPEQRPADDPAEATPGGGPNPSNNDGAGPSAQPVNTRLPVTAAVAVVALFVLLAPAWRRRTLRRRRLSLSGPLIVIERNDSPSTADGSTGDPAASIAGNPTANTTSNIAGNTTSNTASNTTSITADNTADNTAGAILNDLVTDPSAVAVARQDAHQAWAELLDTMIDFSVPVDEAESPRATVNRLVDRPTLVPVRSSAELLARAEERASYARTPVRTEGLNDAVAAARAALASQATRRQRWSATLMPRSVLQRWRLGWAAWLGGVIGRAGQIRDAVASASPRRLLAKWR